MCIGIDQSPNFYSPPLFLLSDQHWGGGGGSWSPSDPLSYASDEILIIRITNMTLTKRIYNILCDNICDNYELFAIYHLNREGLNLLVYITSREFRFVVMMLCKLNSRVTRVKGPVLHAFPMQCTRPYGAQVTCYVARMSLNMHTPTHTLINCLCYE